MDRLSEELLLGKTKNDRGIFDIVIFIVAIVLLGGILAFRIVFLPVDVSGKSMYKTIYDGDWLLINQYAAVKRFDIAVIDIGTKSDGSEINYIKRIIGLPGETVIIENGKVYIKAKNGKITQLDESGYAYYGNNTEGTFVNGQAAQRIWELGDNEIFFMGDNRYNSRDSRDDSIGVKTVDKVVGVVPDFAIRYKSFITKYYEFNKKINKFFKIA